jgi:hypothetical protein
VISDVKFEPVLLLGTVFVTFWYTWLFDRSGGSVFFTIVAHAADGMIGGQLLADHGGFRGASTTGSSCCTARGGSWWPRCCGRRPTTVVRPGGRRGTGRR